MKISPCKNDLSSDWLNGKEKKKKISNITWNLTTQAKVVTVTVCVCVRVILYTKIDRNVCEHVCIYSKYLNTKIKK